MSDLREKVQGRTKQIVGQMVGDDLLVEEASRGRGAPVRGAPRRPLKARLAKQLGVGEMSPRLVLIALAVSFGLAVTFATLTTVKQVRTSFVTQSTTRG